MRRAVFLLSVLAGCTGGRSTGPVAQGTIEVEETDIVTTVEGRVARLWVAEGAMVHSGDTLVTLTSSTLPDDLRQRQARVSEAEASLKDLERGARTEEVNRAEAELRAAWTEDSAAVRELSRMEALFVTRASSQSDVDRARATAALMRGRRETAEQSLALLKAGATREALDAARSRLAQARADLARGHATEGELTLVAPSDGVVMPHYYREGEVVAAGRAVLTIADVSRPWIRVYVNQRDVPSLQVGQAAQAVLDGDAAHPISGRVVAINHQAEYIPRVALTLEERADLMFGIKIALDDASGRAKAGLPASVTIPSPPANAQVAEARP